MKLYTHPMSTTSRVVELFMRDSGIAYEAKVLNMLDNEHLREPFVSYNPNRLVPVLDDDGFKLTESSTILKYLAEKIGSPTYPTDLKQRTRVNEMLDWFNSTFYPTGATG